MGAFSASPNPVAEYRGMDSRVGRGKGGKDGRQEREKTAVE